MNPIPEELLDSGLTYDEYRRSITRKRFAGGYRTEFRRRNFLEILALLRAFFHVG